MSDNDSPIKHLKQKWLCYNLIPGQTYIWHFSGGLHFKLVEANGGRGGRELANASIIR